MCLCSLLTKHQTQILALILPHVRLASATVCAMH